MFKRCISLRLYPPGSSELTKVQRLLTKAGYSGPVKTIDDILDWTDNETVQYVELVCPLYDTPDMSRRQNATKLLTRLLANLRSRGCTIGTYTASKSIILYSNYGSVGEAEKIFKKVITEVGHTPALLTSMSTAYASVGNLTSFRYILRLIEKSRSAPSIHIFNNTLRCLSFGKNEESAVKTLRALAKTNILPNEATVRSFMRCCRGYDSAKKVIISIKEGKWGSEVTEVTLPLYNAWIKVCIRSNEMHRALSILQEIKEAGLTPNSSTYNSLIMVARESGEMDNLKIVLKLMKQANMEPTYVSYLAILTTVKTHLDSCVRSKYEHWISFAEAAFNEAEARRLIQSTSIFTLLGQCYEKVGDLEKIVALRNSLHKHNFDDYDAFILLYSNCLQRRTNCGSVWTPWDPKLPSSTITGETVVLPPSPSYKVKLNSEPDWFAALNEGNYLLGGLENITSKNSNKNSNEVKQK